MDTFVLVNYSDEGALDVNSREEFSFQGLVIRMRQHDDQEYVNKVLDWAEDTANDAELTLEVDGGFDVWSKEA